MFFVLFSCGFFLGGGGFFFGFGDLTQGLCRLVFLIVMVIFYKGYTFSLPRFWHHILMLHHCFANWAMSSDLERLLCLHWCYDQVICIKTVFSRVCRSMDELYIYLIWLWLFSTGWQLPIKGSRPTVQSSIWLHKLLSFWTWWIISILTHTDTQTQLSSSSCDDTINFIWIAFWKCVLIFIWIFASPWLTPFQEKSYKPMSLTS